jgi:cytochrome c556
MTPHRIIAALVATALVGGTLSGCGPAAESPNADNAEAAIQDNSYRTELTMAELMAHVVDHAADGVWLNQGWVVDGAGERELFPTTEEGWLAAENSAATVAEAANLLLLPGRRIDNAGWTDHAQALHKASIEAMKAAEKRDKQAFFDAGGAMYVACRSCHQEYILGEEPMNPPQP